MSIRERLKAVIENQGITIKACSELLGVNYRTLQNYLLGEREPSVELLAKVSEMMNINLNWLFTGEEEMFKQAVKSNSLTEQEIALLAHYRAMSNELQKAVDVSLKAINTELK